MVQSRNTMFWVGSDSTVGMYTMRVQHMGLVNKYFVWSGFVPGKSLNPFEVSTTLWCTWWHGSQHLVSASVKFWETSLGSGTEEIWPVVCSGGWCQWPVNYLDIPILSKLPFWSHGPLGAREIIQGAQCQKGQLCPVTVYKKKCVNGLLQDLLMFLNLNDI